MENSWFYPHVNEIIFNRPVIDFKVQAQVLQSSRARVAPGFALAAAMGREKACNIDRGQHS
jgi:hypothetical protein